MNNCREYRKCRRVKQRVLAWRMTHASLHLTAFFPPRRLSLLCHDLPHRIVLGDTNSHKRNWLEETFRAGNRNPVNVFFTKTILKQRLMLVFWGNFMSISFLTRVVHFSIQPGKGRHCVCAHSRCKESVWITERKTI